MVFLVIQREYAFTKPCGANEMLIAWSVNVDSPKCSRHKNKKAYFSDAKSQLNNPTKSKIERFGNNGEILKLATNLKKGFGINPDTDITMTVINQFNDRFEAENFRNKTISEYDGNYLVCSTP